MPPDLAASWQRLNRGTLVVRPFQELLRALPALLILLVAGASSGQGPLWSVVGVGFTIGYGILRYFTTQYRITPAQVQVRTGLLRRSVLSVPRDRVRTVDVTASALHRLLGLVQVRVGTGRAAEGLKLDALSRTQAAHLRRLLHRTAPAGGGQAPVATGEGSAEGPAGTAPEVGEETELARLDPRWIRYGPFSLSGAVTGGVVLAFLARLESELNYDLTGFGPTRALFAHLTSAPIPLVVGELALAALAFVALASTAGYVLSFYGYRLTRHSGGTLHVARGLLTRRATTIEERRLHGVEVIEPLTLRAVGGARCAAVATGLHGARGAGSLLPPAPRAEAERVAELVLRRSGPVTCPVDPHGPRARRRRYTRALGVVALLAAAATLLWGLGVVPDWAPVAVLAMTPVGALLAADRYRSLGHALVERTVVSRAGSMVRRRATLRCEGIIGWNEHRSFFQRRAGLVTLSATTAAGRQHYDIVDIPTADALALAHDAVPGLLDPFLVSAEAAASARRG
jgi:putative membrane protein